MSLAPIIFLPFRCTCLPFCHTVTQGRGPHLMLAHVLELSGLQNCEIKFFKWRILSAMTWTNVPQRPCVPQPMVPLAGGRTFMRGSLVGSLLATWGMSPWRGCRTLVPPLPLPLFPDHYKVSSFAPRCTSAVMCCLSAGSKATDQTIMVWTF
jgi:hypothetical protein